MDDIEKQDVAPEENNETPETAPSDAPVEEQKEEPKVEKPERTPEEQLSYHERRAQQLRKKLGKEVESEKPVKGNSGELDDTHLDYLDLKGITEDEDISVIKTVLRNTGKTLRDVLKDEYVVSKLTANKQNRERLAATPSSTKRSGQSSSTDVEHWLQEHERTGKLPEDFSLRVKVVEAMERKYGTNAPRWRS